MRLVTADSWRIKYVQTTIFQVIFFLVITILVSSKHKKERHPILFTVYIIFSTYIT